MTMHYFPFYTGDYICSTRHLSMLEHGAYINLLIHYYGRKEPLPDEPDRLYRICNTFTPDEMKAVDGILHEFFYAEVEDQ
jgi:uncharacterized protein YdaU (DUF1376 family)